jgi:ABC-type transport system involved in multi-copper enzyme maturation permease subunit
MKSYLWDARATLTSKSILIIVAIIILVSFTVIPAFAGNTVTGSNPIQVYAYYDNSGYHVLALVSNQFGQGVEGASIQAFLSYSNSTYSAEGITNSSGEAQVVVVAPLNANYYLNYTINEPNGIQSGVGNEQPFLLYSPNGTVQSLPPGKVVNLLGLGNSIVAVSDAANPSRMDIEATWVLPYGRAPVGYQIYYKFLNSSVPTGSLNESNMQFLGTMSSYRQTFHVPKIEPNLSTSGQIVFGVFYPNGTSTSYFEPFSPSELYPPPTQPASGVGSVTVIEFFRDIFGVIVPLLAIIGAYNSYGNDRVSGVLESVLSQTVTRRGLSVTRYLSTFSPMAAATAVSTAIADEISLYFTGQLVDNWIMLALVGAILVELAAFIGIMMLLSHLVRSSGSLVGIGVGIFVVFDFFWGFILAILAGPNNLRMAVIGQFANPVEFVSLVGEYFTHVAMLVGLSPFDFSITPSTYGITISSVVTTAIIWVAVPFAIFLYLATKRD